MTAKREVERLPPRHGVRAARGKSPMTIGFNTAAGLKLAAYADRVERLLDEIDGLKDDLKDLKAQIKNDGFNVQALSKLVAIRRQKGRADREAELLNDLLLYAHATGMPLDVVVGGGFGEEEAAQPPVAANAPAD